MTQPSLSTRTVGKEGPQVAGPSPQRPGAVARQPGLLATELLTPGRLGEQQQCLGLPDWRAAREECWAWLGPGSLRPPTCLLLSCSLPQPPLTPLTHPVWA